MPIEVIKGISLVRNSPGSVVRMQCRTWEAYHRWDTALLVQLACRVNAYQGDNDEHGGGDGTHNVGPHTRAVHQPLEPAQILLEQRAVLIVQHNLEVTL